MALVMTTMTVLALVDIKFIEFDQMNGVNTRSYLTVTMHLPRKTKTFLIHSNGLPSYNILLEIHILLNLFLEVFGLDLLTIKKENLGYLKGMFGIVEFFFQKTIFHSPAL